jgi:hypothetical protein
MTMMSRIVRGRALAGGLALTTMACDDGVVAPAEEPVAQLCARVDAAVARFEGRAVTVDTQWEAVARVVPGGFGGIDFTAAGGPAIYLVDTTRLQQARSAAARAGTCPNGARIEVLGYIASATAVRQGRWDYVQLRQWYGQVWALVDPSIQLSFGDVTESENRLTFGVGDAASQTQLRALVVRSGIPEGAVAVVIAPRTLPGGG